MNVSSENDQICHAIEIKRRLKDIIQHVRADIKQVDDPQAKALFEATAELLHGLITAYDHYEARAEEAWRWSESEEAQDS